MGNNACSLLAFSNRLEFDRDLLNGKYLNWLFLRLQFCIVQLKRIFSISVKEHVMSVQFLCFRWRHCLLVAAVKH